MTQTTATIVTRIINDGRAANNEELINEFEFDAAEAGMTDSEIEDALNSNWFPWMK